MANYPMPGQSSFSKPITALACQASLILPPTTSSSITRLTTATAAPYRFSACGCTCSSEATALASGDEVCIPCSRRGDVLAVPPAAAQCLEERRGVSIPGSLRLNEGEQRRLISILGSQQSEIADGAKL